MKEVKQLDPNFKHRCGWQKSLRLMCGNVGTYPVLIMIGNKGIAVSRHFNLAITEEYGIVAVMVFEAKSFADLLQKKVDVPNVRARQLGIEKGMSVSEALKILA